MSALLPLMWLLGIHVLPVVNAVTCSLKSTAWSRAVWIWTIKVEFDPAADLIRTRSIRTGFDQNSVLESVRTLVVVVLFKWTSCLLLFNIDTVHGVYQKYSMCTIVATTTVLRPYFRNHPGEPVPEENFWTLWCKGRFTEVDILTIRLGSTPFGLTSAHLHHPPILLQTRCPSCHPANSVKALKATNTSGWGWRC